MTRNLTREYLIFPAAVVGGWAASNGIKTDTVWQMILGIFVLMVGSVLFGMNLEADNHRAAQRERDEVSR